MATIVLLSDRSPEEVLPAISGALVATDLDLKIQPLSVLSLGDAILLGPEVVFVDAAENPGQGYAVLRRLLERIARPPAFAIVERRDLERFPWDGVADEILYPSAPEAEIRLRVAMSTRRRGGAHGSRIRLGPMALDVDGYQATVAGRPLNLTFKEFELLRFLASRPGRVFTRPTLLHEVWGYDFYGGTRTVDVHVRRLRSKLGPEYESLIETVRGVGYRAADL